MKNTKKVYFSGITGTGLGPLALLAHDAGYEVSGSDTHAGSILDELSHTGIKTAIGNQDGSFLRKQLDSGLDWFVYTSALPNNHPELILAREYATTHSNFKLTKRDDFTNALIRENNLKLIAVAGTHGKTTTTSMIVYASLQLGLPVSYLVGTTLGFAKSGAYHKSDQYFIYEADEYDRNFLKFHPFLAVIPSISYDHPDIYPTRDDYLAAFDEFKSNSQQIIEPASTIFSPDDFTLAGEARRLDATLAATAISTIAPEISHEKIIATLNNFPGVGRRFERLADGIYSDYAHHPEEIAATIGVALEEVERLGKNGLIVLYEPHQNTRQHEIASEYYDSFIGADRILWLPTFLTRENPNLPILSQADLISNLATNTLAEPVELNDSLWQTIQTYRNQNYLILLMTAGPADHWLRSHIKELKS